MLEPQDTHDDGSTIPVRYTLHLLLEGHTDFIVLEMDEGEQERMMSLLQDGQGRVFTLIEGVHEAVALRLDAVALANFCFDPHVRPSPLPSPGERGSEILLYLNDRPEPVPISVDPDRPWDPTEDEECDQLNGLLFDLEASTGEPGDCLILEDLDGEPVFIKERCLAMVRIPKHLVPEGEDQGPDDADKE